MASIDAVGCARRDPEPLAELVDALMVVRRDVELELVRDVAEQRAGLDGDGVRRVRPDLGAVRREVEAIAEVLLERAAERHVDHLQPATGAEHGHAALAGEPR